MNIEYLLKKLGRTVYLTGSDNWKSSKFNAAIQPLRYKTKLYLSGEYTPIGINKNNVYLYIGPPEHDLTKLNMTYRLHDSCGNSYMIDKAEKIFVGDRPFYIWAVIRQTMEGDI